MQQPTCKLHGEPTAPYDFDTDQGRLCCILGGTMLGVVTNHIDGVWETGFLSLRWQGAPGCKHQPVSDVYTRETASQFTRASVVTVA